MPLWFLLVSENLAPQIYQGLLMYSKQTLCQLPRVQALTVVPTGGNRGPGLGGRGGQGSGGTGGRRCLGVARVRGPLPWACAQARPRAGPSVTFLPHGGAHHPQGHGRVQAHRRPGHGCDCSTPGPAGQWLGTACGSRTGAREDMGWTECDCSATRRAWADLPDLCPHRGMGHSSAGAGGSSRQGMPYLVQGKLRWKAWEKAGQKHGTPVRHHGACTPSACKNCRSNDAVKGRSCFFRVCTVCTCTTVIRRGGLTV